MQAVAAVATEHGVPDAAARLGPSWGFRRLAGHRLGGGERWLAGTARLTGLRLQRFAQTDWAELAQAERAALADSAQLIVAVDSFDIESPYRDHEHLTHALVLHRYAGDEVVVADMTNRPEPHSLPLHVYQKTRLSPVAGGFGIVCRGVVGVPPPSDIVADRLRAELPAHRVELAVLEQFITDVREGRTGPDVDIADVAAERLALSQVVAPPNGPDDRWTPVADALADLSHRWYIVHAMAWAATRGTGTLRPARLVRMLTNLATREADLNTRLSAIMQVGSPCPR
ncbi:hypothetical protein [Micromonospora sp. RP3T]|uniref:hypothetical protein n=1 Tax=Micromonospora sp. RP3T TaxID=2135446 RepID=UPI000D15E0F1|nr:hypothetical protein [Micromonospora sp. RP3T]PTA46449.1 hypothetical protein C8054_10340 [Micromonospora sp. RP3T]